MLLLSRVSIYKGTEKYLYIQYFFTEKSKIKKCGWLLGFGEGLELIVVKYRLIVVIQLLIVVNCVMIVVN